MKDNHITEILDNAPLGSLGEAEQASIREHIETCADCERAFVAAQISALLVKERVSDAAGQTLNANPFFQTRVLSAWREQQATRDAWSFRRLWNATGALMASMAATTAALAVLTFVIPANEAPSQPNVVLIPTSAEAVVLDQNSDGITDDQVLSAIYGDDDEGN